MNVADAAVAATVAATLAWYGKVIAGFVTKLVKESSPMSLASEMNLAHCSLPCTVEFVGNLSLPMGRRNVKRVEIL